MLALAPASAAAQSHVDGTSASSGPAATASPDPAANEFSVNQGAPPATSSNQTAAATNQPPAGGTNSSPAAGNNPMASSPVAFHAGAPIDFSSGETVSQSEQTTFLAMTRFTQTLLDPFVGGRGAADGDVVANAYAAMSGAAPVTNTSSAPRWSVWASGVGASLTSNGNAMPGSGTASSRFFGTVVGADYSLSPQTMAGFAMAGGGTYFNAGNFGSGRSDLFQAGAFVRHIVGQAYVAGALAYGWQAVATDRLGGLASDPTSAGIAANAYSGRVESGYRFLTPLLGIAAYAAGQFTTYSFPFSAGSQTLALGAVGATDSRSEVGVRTDKFLVIGGGLLNLRGVLAWAHDVRADRSTPWANQAGPSYAFAGTTQAFDSALTTASAEMRWSNGWLAAATFEGEFSGLMRSYGGKAVVRYAW